MMKPEKKKLKELRIGTSPQKNNASHFMSEFCREPTRGGLVPFYLTTSNLAPPNMATLPHQSTAQGREL